MAIATTYIDRYHPDKDGKAKVTVRVTHNRIRRYYPTGLSFPPEYYDKVMTAKRRTDAERRDYDLIQAAEQRAKGVIGELPIFTFALFESRYLMERASVGTVAGAFDEYVKELNDEGRYTTAESYKAAKNSIEEYKKGMAFADITPKLLKAYEREMVKTGKSITTVGVYLRSLRTIINRAGIDRSIYPFGTGKDKYSIPTGQNIKKALKLDDVVGIANYEPKSNIEAFARDFWLLSFQLNGMNIKDILHLKRSDVGDNMVTYERAKTAQTKVVSKKIMVSLKDESREIIKRWGSKRIGGKEQYLFDILTPGMTPKEVSNRVKQTIKNINKYMSRIGKELGIDGDMRTYAARHSFATILRRSGVSTEFISEALGHSELRTTAAYLDSFEDEAIHKQTQVLTGLKRKAE